MRLDFCCCSSFQRCCHTELQHKTTLRLSPRIFSFITARCYYKAKRKKDSDMNIKRLQCHSIYSVWMMMSEMSGSSH